MNRSDFIKTEMVDGVPEKDLLLSSFNNFVFEYPLKTYRLQYNDYMRPDLISLKVFGNQDYWWIILKCNPELEDIWNDVAIEQEQEDLYPDAYKIDELIYVPDIRDVNTFIAKYKVK
jgi:hypothetical protein